MEEGYSEGLRRVIMMYGVGLQGDIVEGSKVWRRASVRYGGGLS